MCLAVVRDGLLDEFSGVADGSERQDSGDEAEEVAQEAL